MNNPLIARNGHAVLNGDNTTFKFDSGAIEIIDQDGRCLFSVRLVDARTIRVQVNDITKDEAGNLVDDRFYVVPEACNSILVQRNLLVEK